MTIYYNMRKERAKVQTRLEFLTLGIEAHNLGKCCLEVGQDLFFN